MIQLFTQRFLAVWVVIAISLAVTSISQAQSITIASNVAPAGSLCSNATVTLTFSTTGVFTAGNVFTLQRSNESGSFSNPVVVATLTSRPTSASTLSISG
ncbi:MAG TPA: hypothetical protein VGB67_07500, partial [Fibrella sp.]